MTFRNAVALVAPLVLGLVGSCVSPPVECPPPIVTQDTPVRVAQNVKNKVDILFVIDNSPSMTPKQKELKNQFPGFMDKLDTFSPAWYHIGVVTSDLGAGPMSLGNNACVPGGQGGKLQALPAVSASLTNCSHVGNDTKSGMSANYIDYNQITHTNNLPTGQDVKTTFTCMASVGDTGCGFEHQLESAFRALKQDNADTATANQGFLRDDALLVVVFVTDEDDCSAPQQTDLFDPSKTQYGVANSSFRCTQFGLEYGDPPTFTLPGTEGTWMSIAPAPNLTNSTMGQLFDVNRYISLFKNPKASGGIKQNPDDVILVGITGPVNNDSIDVKVTTPCENNRNVMSCPVLMHSCTLPSDPVNFFGDPAVRINTVINSLTNSKHTVARSTCDTPYKDALDALAAAINATLSPGCLGAPIVPSKDDPNKPDCVVEENTLKPDGSPSITQIP